MTDYVTIKQLTEMFAGLPDDVTAKRIGYLDIGHMTQEDLEDLRNRLLKSSDTWIEQCCN